MSLGGYAAALAATLDAKLDFVVPIIPLASLADFAFEQGSLSESPELRAREHDLLERVYRVASPLARPSLVPPERVLVLGGKADRITPLSHAKRLARHFGVPLTTWHGGHLLAARSSRRVGAHRGAPAARERRLRLRFRARARSAGSRRRR